MNNNNYSLTPWMTRIDAAAYAGVSVDTIDDLAKAGCIKRAKLNPAKCGRVLIDKKSIDNYIKSKMVIVKGEKDNEQGE